MFLYDAFNNTWTQGNGIWKNKVPCSHIVIVRFLLLSEQDKLHFITSSALSRNGEILFTLIEGSWPKVGQLATQSWKEPLREPVACQHCLFMATAEHRARLTQQSPELGDGGGPHAYGGLPPSGTHCRWARSLGWETQENVLSPNLPPTQTCFIRAEWKTILPKQP